MNFKGIIYKKNNKNYVKTVGEQGSFLFSSMARANCLIYLPVEQGKVKLNDKVQILMFKRIHLSIFSTYIHDVFYH